MPLILDVPVPLAAEVRRFRARHAVPATFLEEIPVRLAGCLPEDAPAVMEATLPNGHVTTYRMAGRQLLKNVAVKVADGREMLGGPGLQSQLSRYAQSLRERQSDAPTLWPFVDGRVTAGRISSPADWHEVVRVGRAPAELQARAFWAAARTVCGELFVPSRGPVFLVEAKRVKGVRIPCLAGRMPDTRFTAAGVTLLSERSRLLPAQLALAFGPEDILSAEVAACAQALSCSGRRFRTEGTVEGVPHHGAAAVSRSLHAAGALLLEMAQAEVGRMEPHAIHAYADLAQALREGVAPDSLAGYLAGFAAPWRARQDALRAAEEDEDQDYLVDPCEPLAQWLDAAARQPGAEEPARQELAGP